MRERCRQLDWASTPLGPVDLWPQSLRTTAALVLSAASPMLLAWGDQLVQLYNDAYVPFLFARHPHVLGKSAPVAWPDLWPATAATYEQVMHGDAVVRDEAPLRAPSAAEGAAAETRYVTLSYSPVPDESGHVGGVLVTLHDVTAQVAGRNAEDARARRSVTLQSERVALFEEVFRTTPSFLHVLHGFDFVVELANDAYYQLVGQRDLIGRPAFEAMPEAAQGGYQERIERVMRTGEPFYGRELPVTLARNPGAPPEERLIDLAYLPLRDPDGRITRVLGHGTDVTEHVRARDAAIEARNEAEARRKAQTRYHTLFESMDEGFCVVEVLFDDAGRAVDYRFLEANPAFAKQTGLASVIGRRMSELVPNHDRHWFEAYGTVARTGRSIRFEAPAVAMGRHFDAYAFRFGAPEQHQVAVLFTDVTDRKRADAERERLLDVAEAARSEAEGANLAKSEFLAMMSHELRTPLNAIGGYVELLELGIRGPVTDLQRQDLHRIQQSQRHLLGLINQVLNYTRIDAGALRYDLETVLVADALIDAQALVLPQARARGLSYVTDPVPAGLAVLADREKLQQILLNLLSNAIKFTEPGGEVRLTCAARGEVVELSVSDTGIGIAPEKLAHIFEPFVQVDQRLTRPHEGVGLGLAISRDLARAMGGDLDAVSTVAVGSRFTAVLPIATPSTR